MLRPIADVQSAADTVDAELAKKVQLFLSANRRGFRRVSVWAARRRDYCSCDGLFRRLKALASGRLLIRYRQFCGHLGPDHCRRQCGFASRVATHSRSSTEAEWSGLSSARQLSIRWAAMFTIRRAAERP